MCIAMVDHNNYPQLHVSSNLRRDIHTLVHCTGYKPNMVHMCAGYMVHGVEQNIMIIA